MNEKKEEELKEAYLSWLDRIKIRRLAYDSAKAYLKEAQEKLKIARKVFNRTYKDWKEARLEAERSKRRWKAYPYKMRKWAKENMDKVWELFDKEKK